MPGAKVPAEYAGSLLELDFGEAGETKRVVIVDAEPNIPAAVRSVPLSAGRRLVRASGEWADIIGRDDVHDAYLDLTVHTAGPDPGLADRAREEFDHLVKVRAEYPQAEADPLVREGQPLDRLYAQYFQEREGAEPPEELLAAFREVMEDAGYAAG